MKKSNLQQRSKKYPHNNRGSQTELSIKNLSLFHRYGVDAPIFPNQQINKTDKCEIS